jgi:diguanylate cyclase (GGDEF)-like protein/PAS domain S-box-containing protein
MACCRSGHGFGKMTGIQDHTEILEAALDTLDEGIAVLDRDSRILFWNRSAAAITGYQSIELLSRPLPSGSYRIDGRRAANETGISAPPLLVHLKHRQGHTLPATLRRTPLRDALGSRFGTLLRFHPVEEIDALPHGEATDNAVFEHGLEDTQAELRNRLDTAYQDWINDCVPFGVLWITVDQAAKLRKSHGHDASEAMLAIVERTLLHGLRPAETLGRWGDNEFLALCHERSPELLRAHAQRLADLTRTADFHWWGDRIALTVSIGAAQAEEGESLSALLASAQQAMLASVNTGGNHVSDSGGHICSQS